MPPSDCRGRRRPRPAAAGRRLRVPVPRAGCTVLPHFRHSGCGILDPRICSV